ncbi:hypothetical protein PAPYR_10337 [Paratrimastix pyriformis]|uniref:Uncharacterized protein n=1 Tax=Paratrimastix pyriformis TaxID=342808 RepID=A0ABQ8U661_9EUKA|nr:hypothetical protein PAPYR_10337 [Paratrimastix pyriformis]
MAFSLTSSVPPPSRTSASPQIWDLQTGRTIFRHLPAAPPAPAPSFRPPPASGARRGTVVLAPPPGAGAPTPTFLSLCPMGPFLLAAGSCDGYLSDSDSDTDTDSDTDSGDGFWLAIRFAGSDRVVLVWISWLHACREVACLLYDARCRWGLVSQWLLGPFGSLLSPDLARHYGPATTGGTAGASLGIEGGIRSLAADGGSTPLALPPAFGAAHPRAPLDWMHGAELGERVVVCGHGAGAVTVLDMRAGTPVQRWRAYGPGQGAVVQVHHQHGSLVTLSSEGVVASWVPPPHGYTCMNPDPVALFNPAMTGGPAAAGAPPLSASLAQMQLPGESDVTSAGNSGGSGGPAQLRAPAVSRQGSFTGGKWTPGYLLQAGRGSDTFYTPERDHLGYFTQPEGPLYWAQLVAAQTPRPKDGAAPDESPQPTAADPFADAPAQQSLAPRYWEGSGGSLGTSWAGSCGPVPRSGWVGANSAALMPPGGGSESARPRLQPSSGLTLVMTRGHRVGVAHVPLYVRPMVGGAEEGDEDREAEAGGLLDGGLPQAAGGRGWMGGNAGQAVGRRVELPIHPVPGAHLGDLIRSVTALPALGLIVTGWQDGTIRYSHCPR